MKLKRIYYKDEKELEALRYCARVIDFGQSLLAYAALNEMLNAYIVLRNDYSDMFKKDVKKYANMAERNGRRKDIEMKSVMLHKNFAESYFDTIIDAAHEDIVNMRNAIQETLQDAKYDKAVLVSYLETARVLLEAIVTHFNTLMHETQVKFNVIRDFSNEFLEFKLSSVLHPWQRLCDIIYNNTNDTIDLNTKKTENVIHTVLSKFANGDYVGECSDVAKEENPDFQELEVKITKQREKYER